MKTSFYFVVWILIYPLLGLVYIVLGLLLIFGSGAGMAGAVAGMYFLYGSLATYFGIKDLIASVSSKSFMK